MGKVMRGYDHFLKDGFEKEFPGKQPYTIYPVDDYVVEYEFQEGDGHDHYHLFLITSEPTEEGQRTWAVASLSFAGDVQEDEYKLSEDNRSIRIRMHLSKFQDVMQMLRQAREVEVVLYPDPGKGYISALSHKYD